MYILTVTKTKPYRAVLSRLWDFVTNSDLMKVGSTHTVPSLDIRYEFNFEHNDTCPT